MQSGSKGYGLYLKNFCVELWESNKKRSLQYLRTSCSARETFVAANGTPPMHSMGKPSVSFIFTYIYDKIFH